MYPVVRQLSLLVQGLQCVLASAQKPLRSSDRMSSRPLGSCVPPPTPEPYHPEPGTLIEASSAVRFDQVFPAQRVREVRPEGLLGGGEAYPRPCSA